MKNKGFHIFSIAILTALISYITNNGINARHKAQTEIVRHAQVVAESLWNFESQAPKAYVEQAIRNDFYEKFIIKTDSGRVLLSSTGHPIENFSDRIFASLKLIPTISLSCDVIYMGRNIGKIDVVARIKTIYSNLYALALCLLSFLAVKFFFTILKSNRELDFRVHERTVELEIEIRERQKVEETLRESEERFRLIFENSPLAIVHFNKDGIITTCNDNLCKILGSLKDNLVGSNTQTTFKDTKMINAISSALSGQNSQFYGEYLSVAGSESRYLEAYFGPIFSIDGLLLGAIGIFADISKRKQAEGELIAEKAFTEKVVNSLPGIFYTFNDDQHLIKWNTNLENFLGKSAEAITKDDFKLLDFIAEDDKAKIINEIQYSQRTGKNISLETHFIAKDGSKVPMLFTACYMNIGDKKYFIGVGIDISEKKKLETELQQAQKMEAIGTLAGGIAHDFNNILTAILGYTEMAKDEINDVESLRIDLDEVLMGAERAKELVKQILTFSRKNDQELQPLKIQRVIKEALKLLRSTIPTTIEIKQDINFDCDAILADPTQIHQVIMNLCTNAYHAMRETGGVLGVSLKSVELTQDIVDNTINLSPGRYIRLEISDTGSGIPKEVQDRIFEPYYTTKPKGEGTGLGLAVAHGIITNLNGDITLYSEVNSGTTFRIYLPVVTSASESMQKKTTPVLPTGDERILLVDDDPTIAQLITKILIKLGYNVTTFTNSADAMQKFYQLPDAFDLIITDMTMPYMTGAELSKNILKIRPDMKIIMCTGFSDLINEDKAKAIGICDYIMKPVVKNNLAVVVRKVLDL